MRHEAGAALLNYSGVGEDGGVFDVRPAADLKNRGRSCRFKDRHPFCSKGHGDQRGAALGHGAPGVSDHGRALHRAGEEGEARERGREAGPRGPGRLLPEPRVNNREGSSGD